MAKKKKVFYSIGDANEIGWDTPPFASKDIPQFALSKGEYVMPASTASSFDAKTLEKLMATVNAASPSLKALGKKMDEATAHLNSIKYHIEAQTFTGMKPKKAPQASGIQGYSPLAAYYDEVSVYSTADAEYTEFIDKYVRFSAYQEPTPMDPESTLWDE